ncbi:hypothetical protein F5146DRAFT_1053182 [Armillaria mellea]|nr:hypothetical protein F5146DRAFT_1053182 [Armillaria mellea]
MTKVKGVTLQDWLRVRIKYLPEFRHYLALLEGPPQTRGTQIHKEISEIFHTFKPILDLSDSAHLIDELKNTLTELRSIPPPPSGEASGPRGMPFICMHCTDPCVLQSFKNIPPFHDMLLSDMSWESRISRLQQLASLGYDKLHKLCFSHCDLNKTNIIVSEDGRLAAIVNWETAGWSPEYWELTMTKKQSMGSEVMPTFWNSIGVFGNGLYDKELELEQALWRSNGDMSVPPDVVPDNPLDVPLMAPYDLI